MGKWITSWIGLSTSIELVDLIISKKLRTNCDEMSSVWKVARKKLYGKKRPHDECDRDIFNEFMRIWSEESDCDLSECLDQSMRELSNNVLGVVCDYPCDVSTAKYMDYTFYVDVHSFRKSSIELRESITMLLGIDRVIIEQFFKSTFPHVPFKELHLQTHATYG